MRAAPALQVTLARFTVWRLAVALVSALAAAAPAAWAAHRLQAGPAWRWAIAAGLLGAAAAFALGRRDPLRLSWDGTCWRLGPVGIAADELPRITPRVMIDLGAFLLLRCEPDDTRAAQWLPLQRAGLEASWHALRCAVYSPRPASSAPPDGPSPPA